MPALSNRGTRCVFAAALLLALTQAACGGESATEAGSDALVAAPADPSNPGSQAVYQASLSVRGSARTIGVTLYAPSSDGGKTIAAAGRPFPLVIVSPGFQMATSQYASYARLLASWGLVALVQDYPGGFSIDHNALAKQVSDLIGWAGQGGTPLVGIADLTRVATAGHSLGGKVSFLSAARDARIRAVVGWDPVDSGSPSVTPELMPQVKVPVAVLGETTDASGGLQPCAPAADNYQQYFNAAGSPALEVTVNKADHLSFVDNPNCFLFCSFCTRGSADPVAVKSLAHRTTVAFLRSTLLGDSAQSYWLTGAGMQADATAGRVAVRSK